MAGSPATPRLLLVPVSPCLVWRGGLPGTPDCCFEHARQTRLFSEAPAGDDRLSIAIEEVVMETIVERPAALDVHKAQVTACVRVPGAGGGREQHVARVPDDGARAAGAARLAGGAPGDAGRDGGDRRLLEAGLGDPRGRVRAAAGQRPPRQAGPGPQDRRLGRGVAVPAAGGRAVAARASCRPSRSARCAT